MNITENLFSKDFDAEFVLNKWVPALRSGEFEQGKSALKQVDPLGNASYCCIGVACELANLPLVKLTDTKRNLFSDNVPEEMDVYAVEGDTQLGVSVTLAKKIGLEDAFGEFIDGECVVRSSLADLNDTEDVDFKGIADVIERHAKARLAERGV